MTEEKNHMRQSGIDDVVTKPIEPLELARVLGEVTGIGSAAPAATEPSSAGASHATGSVETVPQSEVGSLKDMAYRLWLQLEWDDSASNGGAPSGESEFEQILDIADTYSRSGESARRTRLIFNAFLSSFKDPLAELHQAKTEGDCDKLKRASHALKGLLLDIGAKRAGKLAGAIEQSSKDEKFDEGAQHITSLSTQALTVARLVEKLVEALPAGKHKAKETAVVVTEQALMLPTPSLPMPAGPVDSAKFVALAHHAVKETIVTLSDIELRNLVPANILAAGGGHPAIELVYQLLDVHGVVAREGHNTARSLLVFGAFLHGYEDLLRELDRSSGERDLDNLKAVSRALRDVLADTGCPLGADIAHQIEQLCELGSAPEALALCESLKIQTHLVGKMVRRIMDEAGA
jgi:HPt (histidine-containing phosphotransfer) domain-containing protein